MKYLALIGVISAAPCDHTQTTVTADVASCVDAAFDATATPVCELLTANNGCVVVAAEGTTDCTFPPENTEGIDANGVVGTDDWCVAAVAADFATWCGVEGNTNTACPVDEDNSGDSGDGTGDAGDAG